MLAKSIRPSSSPIGGMTMPSTRSVTILPNAAPMMTPTARSMTLPRARKWRNSFQTFVIAASAYCLLDFDLHPELDDPFRRQAEEGGCPYRVARHQHEQLLAPDRHAA